MASNVNPTVRRRRLGQELRRLRELKGMTAEEVAERLLVSQSKISRLENGRRGKGDFISLWASTRRISLLEFAGRWTGAKSVGATASILVGKRKTYPGAFIADVVPGKCGATDLSCRSKPTASAGMPSRTDCVGT